MICHIHIQLLVAPAPLLRLEGPSGHWSFLEVRGKGGPQLLRSSYRDWLVWSVEVQWSRAQVSITEQMSRSFNIHQTFCDVLDVFFSWQIVESPGKNQAVELLVKAEVGQRKEVKTLKMWMLSHGPIDSWEQFFFLDMTWLDRQGTQTSNNVHDVSTTRGASARNQVLKLCYLEVLMRRSCCQKLSPLWGTVENLLKAGGGASLCFILFHHSSVLNCAFIIVDQVWVLEYIAPEV